MSLGIYDDKSFAKDKCLGEADIEVLNVESMQAPFLLTLIMHRSGATYSRTHPHLFLPLTSGPSFVTALVKFIFDSSTNVAWDMDAAPQT